MKTLDRQRWYYRWCNKRAIALTLSALVLGSASIVYAPAIKAQGMELPPQPPIDEADAENHSLVSAAHSKSAASTGGDSTRSQSTAHDDDTASSAALDRPFAPPGDIKGLGLSLPGNDFMMPEGNVLKGRISADGGKSPILYGSVQSIPKNTKVEMTLKCYLNSELSQKGDEVFARISRDVGDENGKVFLPGNWIAHGFVTNVDKQKKNGRDGFVDVKFDRIISPDGEYDLPFETSFSTKDHQLKAVAKTVYRDAKFATKGAIAGSLLSLQMTGLPLAVSTYGISIGIGATAGATYGLGAAMLRKGKIAANFPGDHIQLKIAEPISLPGFNPLALDSAKNKDHLDGLSLTVTSHKFEENPVTKDKNGLVLVVGFVANNDSKTPVKLSNLQVVSEMNDSYDLFIGAVGKNLPRLAPGKNLSITLPFLVDGKKLKYFLVLRNEPNGKELARTPIN